MVQRFIWRGGGALSGSSRHNASSRNAVREFCEVVLVFTRVLHRTPLAVILEGACPPHREVLGLGRQCSLVYGLLWESAFKDVRLDDRFPYNRKLACGGCTSWSVKGIARECHLGKSSVIEALKGLLDAGFIQYAGYAFAGGGWRRRFRVTHPDHLEAVRYAISVTGLPSLKYNETHDQTETCQAEAWEADLDGNVWPEDCGERCDDEAGCSSDESVSDRDREGGCVLVPGEV